MSTTPLAAPSPPDAEPAALPLTRQEVQLLLPAPDSPAAAMLRRDVVLGEAGAPIARLVDVPADAPAQPHSVPAANLRPGKHVAWDSVRSLYIAQKSGHVILERGQLRIEDTWQVAADLDANAGPITFPGPVLIRGNILDLVALHAAGPITVHGAIEAADIHCPGDLHVQRGICGKEKGHITVGGRLTARFLTNAHVTAAGDVVIANEIANTILACGGALKIDNGTILGGHVTALTGLTCHTAGSPAGVKTILELGLAPEKIATLQQAATAVDTARQKAHDIRAAIEPLLARAKNLTAAQKEKATELLFAADEAEAAARQHLATLDQARGPLQACLGVPLHITGLLHPGTIIRYPLAEAAVTAPLRGPVQITLLLRHGEPQIVAVDRHRNTTLPLPTTPLDEPHSKVLRQLLTAAPLPPTM